MAAWLGGLGLGSGVWGRGLGVGGLGPVAAGVVSSHIHLPSQPRPAGQAAWPAGEAYSQACSHTRPTHLHSAPQRAVTQPPG